MNPILYSKVSNKRGTTAIYFRKNPPTTRLFATLISLNSKNFLVNVLIFLSGNTNSFEISVYLLHFTWLHLFIAWDLSSTTLIRCTTAIRYFRVLLPWKVKKPHNSTNVISRWLDSCGKTTLWLLVKNTKKPFFFIEVKEINTWCMLLKSCRREKWLEQ